MAGERLDRVAASLFPDFSRSLLQQWIREGTLMVAGHTAKPKDRVLGGEALSLNARQQAQGDWQPQAMALEIVAEDEDLLVVNKPPGLVVHPGAGNPDGTLLNALLHHAPHLETLPRAGIVHRLDKDTSGLMVVAKTARAYKSLVAQLQARTVSREYQAVVQGVMVGGGTVEAAIGRHPRVRTRMAVVGGGKPAVSHYRVMARFAAHTHVRVNLETGRTHQIRVHMAYIGHPLVGDSVYGGRLKLPAGASDALVAALRGFRRQALHAAALRLEHPASGESRQWHAPLPEDLVSLLEALGNG
jgi:23S rRNA pseudouridine1911/1915/1917 synthase